jgi:DNA-binding ferritin-like protein
MIEQLIPRVFAARDMAHKAHWKTANYAQHVALGEFYEEVIPALDAIVEAYQGMFGKVEADDSATLPKDITKEFPAGAPMSTTSVDVLRSEVEWIEANRELICSGVDAIGNLVDTLTGVYLKAAYKLGNLQ